MKKLSHAWILAFVPFVFAACAGPETADDAETASEEALPATEATPPAEPPTTAPEAGSFMAQFQPINESGASGQVELSALGEATSVRVTLSGAGEGAHQGHIHTGTCDAPGDVVAPLSPITSDAAGAGEGTSEVSVPLATVMDGNHIVLYHEAGGEPGAPVACAPIPAQQPATM
jgi:hypothetical protein